MSWVRVDDRANEHQKQLAAGPLACWLWMCGLMYCNRQKAHDGFIHDAAVSILYPMPNAKRHAEKLVEVGLWDRVDGGGYRIHDYHDYQPTKEQVDEIKAKRAEAGSKGGKQKAARLARARETSDLAEAKQTPSNLPDECCDSALAKVCPDPDPDPDPQQTKQTNMSAPPTGASPDARPDQVYEHWVACRAPHLRGDPPKFTTTRRNMIRARLRDGFDVEALRRAATGIWTDPWNLEDPSGRISFEICYRNAGQVERYAGKAAAAEPPKPWQPRAPTPEPSEPTLPIETFAADSGVHPLLATALAAGDKT